MSAPFLKKEKDGISVNLHQALYSLRAIEAFQKADSGVAVSRKGPYWSLKFSGSDEAGSLDALDRLLLLSKGQRTK